VIDMAVIRLKEGSQKVDAVSSAAPCVDKSVSVYQYEERVTFRYTNAEGNVSHDKYAELFGVVREHFGMDYIPNFAKEAGHKYLLKTRNARYDYLKDFSFGDKIVIKMFVVGVTAATFTLRAEFINAETGEVHATGEQQIVFADMQGAPKKIPAELRSLLNSVKYSI